MRENVQTRALAPRSLRSFIEVGERPNLPVPTDELVTRSDLQAFRKEVSLALRDAVRELAQERHVAPPEVEAPSQLSEVEAIRRRMRSMAD